MAVHVLDARPGAAAHRAGEPRLRGGRDTAPAPVQPRGAERPARADQAAGQRSRLPPPVPPVGEGAGAGDRPRQHADPHPGGPRRPRSRQRGASLRARDTALRRSRSGGGTTDRARGRHGRRELGAVRGRAARAGCERPRGAKRGGAARAARARGIGGSGCRDRHARDGVPSQGERPLPGAGRPGPAGPAECRVSDDRSLSGGLRAGLGP